MTELTDELLKWVDIEMRWSKATEEEKAFHNAMVVKYKYSSPEFITAEKYYIQLKSLQVDP